jgi:chromosome segregation ATPase
MIMNQKIFLDLTPLLDVVLILLFAFMLSINAASSKKDMELNGEQELNNELQTTINEKEQQIAELENNILDLQKEVDNLNNNIDEISFDIANGKNTLFYLSENLARWFSNNENTLEEIAENKDIAKLLDDDTILRQLHKYETISKKYFFIDINLKSNQNKLFINKQDTNVYISLEEIDSKEGRTSKIEQIKDIIEEVIDDREGGYTFILITLSEEDHVYRYAFNLVWDAIKDIQQKYGIDKIFKTKYVLPVG